VRKESKEEEREDNRYYQTEGVKERESGSFLIL
jgi:hypothetical protein